MTSCFIHSFSQVQSCVVSHGKTNVRCVEKFLAQQITHTTTPAPLQNTGWKFSPFFFSTPSFTTSHLFFLCLVSVLDVVPKFLKKNKDNFYLVAHIAYPPLATKHNEITLIRCVKTASYFLENLTSLKDQLLSCLLHTRKIEDLQQPRRAHLSICAIMTTGTCRLQSRKYGLGTIIILCKQDC